MKILYLNPTGSLGGAELCLLDVLASLRSARPDWRLKVVLGDDGPLREAVEELDVACTVLPLPGRVARLGDAGLAGRAIGRGLGLAARAPGAVAATAGYVSRLRRLIRSEAPDRLQSNGMKAHVLAAWSAPRGLPIVWHLHDYVGARPVMARLLRLSGRPSISAVAVSHSVAADASAVLGRRVRRVETIHNAIDLDRFAPGPGEGARLDEAAGLPPAPSGTTRVGLVATFATWKGHDVFLQAAARVAAAPGPPCRFYIVGGPIYRSVGSQHTVDGLRARAEALGLADRVGFTGHQADPAAAIRALDVVVHASTRPEPFGRVIVEAMACGRAVVAMQAGGAAELFDDGATALGCPPGDPVALAGAIARLVADPSLRRRLGDAGHQAAIERFDRSRLADAWIAVLKGAGGPVNEPGMVVQATGGQRA